MMRTLERRAELQWLRWVARNGQPCSGVLAREQKTESKDEGKGASPQQQEPAPPVEQVAAQRPVQSGKAPVFAALVENLLVAAFIGLIQSNPTALAVIMVFGLIIYFGLRSKL